MGRKIRVPEAMLEKAFRLLNEQYVKCTSKASAATKPELVEKYNAKAKEINEVIEAIAWALEDGF